MTRSAFAKPARWARALWADTDGIILPYVTVMLVVLVGTSVLAVDGSRYMSLQSELQKAADALAIAGAWELDRLADSTDRAKLAVDNLVVNKSLSGLGGTANVAVSRVRFLSSIPNNDYEPITAVLCTPPGTACTLADNVAARFIEVSVVPVSVPTILPVVQTSVTAGATAVAGNDKVSCGLTPIFICNPFEQVGDSYARATQKLQEADTDQTFRRRLVKLADAGGPGGSGTWGPGDFGYLIPETGTVSNDSCFPGGQEMGRALAQDKPLICVRQNGVDMRTGNMTDAIRGLNTRFGKYDTPQLQDSACKTKYPPDRNVRTWWTPQGGSDWCQGVPDGDANGADANWPGVDVLPPDAALPADACLRGSNACSPTPNIGADSWDCATYWDLAHPPATGHAAPPGCTSAASIPRYEVYEYEIANNYLGDQSVLMSDGTSRETGTPQCAGTTPTANRRILFVAVVNCLSSPVAVQSNATNVPVAAFAKFFLTVAVPTAGQVKPYAEFRGLVQRGDGVIFDQIQLYR